MIVDLIAWCVFGLIVGAIARLLTPGSDSIGCLGTIVVGIVGSVVGGFLGNLLFGDQPANQFRPAGYVGAIIGGIVVLVIVRLLRPPQRI
jgi:uncharacterized membrane protein YeaQ/YmgE (transglycosylase-associated protein family)